ncbi:MAG: hypothetical protein GC158_15485 [Cyanobacteria bacterium RI_101]|nr:hypothetical protein [Cyanobacteria bacterium RI_101]
MNAKFRFYLLNYASTRRQRGFALPMVMMVGLVIAVVGATMVIQGMEDNNKVVSQKAKAEANAAAEAGVARVQNLLNTTKFLALYPVDQWATVMAPSGSNSVTISDSTLQSYVTQLATSQAQQASGSDICTFSTPTSTQIANKETAIKQELRQLYNLASSLSTATAFEPLDSNNSAKGSFKLIRYDYSGTAGVLPGSSGAAARLIVRGRAPGNKGSSTISLEMPITGAPATLSSPFPAVSGNAPGLWVKEGGVNDLSKPESSYNDSAGTFDANILISDCTGTISNSYITALNTAQQARAAGPFTAARATNPMPSIPPIPAGVTAYTLSGSASLPRTVGGVVETPAADGYYYYQTTGDLGDLTIDHTGNKKYRIYLNGDIPKTTEVNSKCKDTAGCEPTNLQIFGMNSTGEICMNGNSDRQVDAYVLAPNYALGKTGNGNFYGTFIVKSFGKIGSCGSNNGKLALVQSQAWSTVPSELRPPTTSTPFTLPKLGSGSSWGSLDEESSPPPFVVAASSPTPTPTTTPTTSPTTAPVNPSPVPSVVPSVLPSVVPSVVPSPVAMCTIPNYLNKKANQIPSTWNTQGGQISVATSVGNGNNSKSNYQNPSAGLSVACTTTVNVSRQ